MAVYEESIRKAIAAGILYEDLPPKLQYVTTPQEWKTK